MSHVTNSHCIMKEIRQISELMKISHKKNKLFKDSRNICNGEESMGAKETIREKLALNLNEP